MFSLAVYWFPPRQRTILRIVSSIRKVLKNKTATAEYQHRPPSTSHGRMELDMHADTTVLGLNCVVLSYTGKECEVSPNSSEYEAVRNVPVVTGATVWTNTTDGTAYLLIFHESLCMGDKLDHTLVNPNRLRAYSVSVQDNSFDTKPLSITSNDGSVELYLEGTIICGDTRTPTESELGQLPRLILTSPHDWDPHNVCFPSCSGQSSGNTPIKSNHSILAVDTLLQHTIYNPIMVTSLMSSHVQVAEVATPSALQDVPLARTFQSKECHSTVTPSDLHWIGSSNTNAQGHHTMVDAFRHTPIGAPVPSGQDVHKTMHSRYNLHRHYEWSLQIIRWQQTCANLC